MAYCSITNYSLYKLFPPNPTYIHRFRLAVIVLCWKPTSLVLTKDIILMTSDDSAYSGKYQIDTQVHPVDSVQGQFISGQAMLLLYRTMPKFCPFTLQLCDSSAPWGKIRVSKQASTNTMTARWTIWDIKSATTVRQTWTRNTTRIHYLPDFIYWLDCSCSWLPIFAFLR